MGHTLLIDHSRIARKVSEQYSDFVAVPCGSCRECCTDVVLILEREGDVIANYEHEQLPGPGPEYAVALKRKPDGTCVYLNEAGCSIHDRPPYPPHLCRRFDCRVFFLNRTRNERRDLLKRGLAKPEIFAAARHLLKRENEAGSVQLRNVAMLNVSSIDEMTEEHKPPCRPTR